MPLNSGIFVFDEQTDTLTTGKAALFLYKPPALSIIVFYSITVGLIENENNILRGAGFNPLSGS